MDSINILNTTHKLPQMPKVVQELMDMVNSGDVNLNKVAEKIQLEQVISARVLRLANSAYFGRNREVGSINEAVIRIGLQPIRTLVLASSLVDSFPKIKGVNISQFWAQTFEVANLCKTIAKSTETTPDEAFTAGVMHSIGDLVVYTAVSDRVADMQALMETGKSWPEAQRIIINTDSASIGSDLANSWKFAEPLVNAIRKQYEPAVDADAQMELAHILRLSIKINTDWNDIADDDKANWLTSQEEFGILGLHESLVSEIDDSIGKGAEMAGAIM